MSAEHVPATTMTTATSPATRKSSLYRLRPADSGAITDLRSYVLPHYLNREGFEVREVNHEGIVGLLVTGAIAPGPADWCAPLSALSGHLVTEENRTALALYLLRTEEAIYALAYGMGHLMIDQARIDPGFGIELATRSLDADQITKVRRQVMDARGRTDENSATGGQNIRGFGIEQFGEIVSQIAGKVADVPLTFTQGRSRTAHITGNDRSVKLPLGSTPASLLHDLQQIEEICARPSPLPEFDFIAQVRPLPPKSEQAQRLDERLDAMLGGGEPALIALAVPSICRDRYDAAESFKVTLEGRSQYHTELDIDELVEAVRHRPPGGRLHALRKGRIQMFADAEGNELISSKVPADHWVTAEVSEGSSHYFYWQRRWYEVGAEYLSVVERRIAELLSRPTTVTMPPWPKGNGPKDKDEDWYNKQVAAQAGYVLLDKNTVRTARLRGGGLEICDELGPAGQFICVKKAEATAELNHLFAQGRVAMETLRFDTEAQEKFLAKVDELAPGHPLDRTFRAPTLVYGILLKDGVPLTAKSLFAFAKVSLLHTVTALEGMGVGVEIVSISRTSVTGVGAPRDEADPSS